MNMKPLIYDLINGNIAGMGGGTSKINTLTEEGIKQLANMIESSEIMLTDYKGSGFAIVLLIPTYKHNKELDEELSSIEKIEEEYTQIFIKGITQGKEGEYINIPDSDAEPFITITGDENNGWEITCTEHFDKIFLRNAFGFVSINGVRVVNNTIDNPPQLAYAEYIEDVWIETNKDGLPQMYYTTRTR